MKKIVRFDKISSIKSFVFSLFFVFSFFGFAESVLRNFSPMGDTLNNFEFYAGVSFSEEELETAIKAREDLASIGDKIIGIPGTLVYKYKPAETSSFTFNSFGFRGGEPAAKEPDEYRIGVFGDSRILGIYLKTEDTIPGVLQKRLESEFPGRKITVFNAGIEGYDLQREIAFAELDAENMELDMVVFYFGGNDINYSFEKGNIDWKPFDENDVIYQNLVENIADNRKKSFFERSCVISALKEAFLSDYVNFSASFEKELVFQPLIPEFEKRAGEFVSKFFERAEKTSEKFKRRGIETVFFFSPLIQMKTPLSNIEQNMLYRNEMIFPGHNNYFLRCAEGIVEREYPVVFTQKNIFEGHSGTMFYDGLHFTPEASRIVGGDVAEKIAGLLKKSGF
ncbi:SGNH/GDSL hydrolase family protein [bacterium]|nr:SGNH/GDSL hydrolase family protein [bacterium]